MGFNSILVTRTQAGWVREGLGAVAHSNLSLWERRASEFIESLVFEWGGLAFHGNVTVPILQNSETSNHIQVGDALGSCRGVERGVKRCCLFQILALPCTAHCHTTS